jgi:hypothetical protein
MCDDEVFPLPLFHGTSTYFLRDIIQHGIASVSVHERLRSRDFLRQVWSLRLELAREDERVELLAWPGSMIDHMIGDRVSAGGFNFRYGQFYCTAEERKAVAYATNAFGSELITEGAKLLDEVRLVAPAKADELLARYAEIARCLAFDHEPVLLKFEGVERSAVLGEGGEQFSPAEERIAQFLSFEVRPTARYSSVSVFEVVEVQFDSAGVASYKLIPAKGAI